MFTHPTKLPAYPLLRSPERLDGLVGALGLVVPHRHLVGQAPEVGLLGHHDWRRLARLPGQQ